ncbi:hypothetical protein [Glycomyces sp. NPDC021274]|uniref:hypothetical protein n=1 Tax=Glycomyces sp. NPDC021274 TaxID=3155120 RepID=UPI0033E2E778
MPRRPPARVRAQQRRHPRPTAPWRRLPRLPHASSTLHAAVQLLELHHAWLGPGDVARSFNTWRRIANRPTPSPLGYGFVGECGIWGCCPPSREALEMAMRDLPTRPARELRRLIAPLDERFRNRTFPDPTAPPGPWWTRRC